MRNGDIPARVGLVVSNNPFAKGLVVARQAKVPEQVIDHRDYADRQTFEVALGDALQASRTDLILLGGFMRILGQAFVERFANRILNIHPSLLPRHPGLDTHRRAIAAGDAWHGATVHVVTPNLDDGQVLGQARVPVMPDDTPTGLAARVLAQEHRLYPLVLARLLALDCVGPCGIDLTGKIDAFPLVTLAP